MEGNYHRTIYQLDVYERQPRLGADALSDRIFLLDGSFLLPILLKGEGV